LALLWPLAWRSLWRNPRRTLITLVVVAIGVWSILTFDVMLKAFADSSKDEGQRLLTGEGQVHAAGYLDDPSITRRLASPQGPLLAALNAAPVGPWVARVRTPAIVQSEYRTRAVTLMGVDPKRERTVSDLPKLVVEGRYLTGLDDGGVVIG